MVPSGKIGLAILPFVVSTPLRLRISRFIGARDFRCYTFSASAPRAKRKMPNDELPIALARFVERVSAIARTGLAFKPDGFDAERYRELIDETARISAHLENADDARAKELGASWNANAGRGYLGYVTAAVGCGVIAFDDRDEI